jgi:putative flippase GtrA
MLAITLVDWDPAAEYDRTGLTETSLSILDVTIPHVIIPVRPGRNVGTLVEVAALNHKLKSLGIHTAQLMQERIVERMVGQTGHEAEEARQTSGQADPRKLAAGPRRAPDGGSAGLAGHPHPGYRPRHLEGGGLRLLIPHRAELASQGANGGDEDRSQWWSLDDIGRTGQRHGAEMTVAEYSGAPPARGVERAERLLQKGFGLIGARFLVLRFPRLVTYVFIGGSAAVVDLCVFSLLFNLVGLAAVTANVIAVAVATVESFTLNSLFNFGKTDRMLVRLSSFVSVSTAGLMVGSAIILLLHDWGGLDGNLAKLASMPCVITLQFVLNKHVTFR